MLPEPNRAFQLAAKARHASTVIASFTPAPDHYLSRDRISFRVLQRDTLTITGVTFPKGEGKEDPNFGSVEVFKSAFEVVLGTALFTMAIGMGLPLLVLTATAGAVLPKAGPWMVAVNRVFGVLMLAVAAYMLSPVLPVAVQQLVWASLLIVPAIYLHALDPLPGDAPGHRRLMKGLGVLALVFGISMLVGALSGNRDVLQPLAGLRAANTPSRNELQFTTVSSVSDLEQKLHAARGRSVMLDFWAEWCVSCLEMDRFTFSDPRVQTRLKDVVLLRADVTANTDDHRALLRRFSLFGPPGIVFFDEQGTELPLRVIGYQRSEQSWSPCNASVHLEQRHQPRQPLLQLERVLNESTVCLSKPPFTTARPAWPVVEISARNEPHPCQGRWLRLLSQGADS